MAHASFWHGSLLLPDISRGGLSSHSYSLSRWRTSLVFLENRKDRHVDREFPWGLGSFCLVLDRHHSSSRTTRSHKTQRSLPMYTPHEGGPANWTFGDPGLWWNLGNSPKTAATKKVCYTKINRVLVLVWQVDGKIPVDRTETAIFILKLLSWSDY